MPSLVLLSVAATLVYYAYLSYEDWRSREISSKAFYLFAPVIIVINAFFFEIYQLPVLVNAAVGLFSFFLIYILSIFGLMGRGDAFIVSYIFLLNPFPVYFLGIPIFPGFIAVAFSFFFPLFIILRNVAVNLKRIDEFENLTRGLGILSKAYYFTFGEVMSRGEFRKKKFYFPLLAPGMKRLHANMELDPLDPEKYPIDGEFLIASYGIPLATATFIGYIAFLLSFPLGLVKLLLLL